MLTAWVDVQKDRIECEIMGSGLGEEFLSIQYIRIYGNTLLPYTWETMYKNLFGDPIELNQSKKPA